MIALVLWLLATLDASFTSYREAAGRNALIDKRAYYRRAMLEGALFGQVAIAIAVCVIAVIVWFAGNPKELFEDFNRVGARMLVIYIPYAAIILFAIAIRAIPSVDIRSITSTLIFGPFTLIRPLVAIVGLIYGLLAAPRVETIVLGLVVLAMMLSLEKSLSLFRLARDRTTER